MISSEIVLENLDFLESFGFEDASQFQVCRTCLMAVAPSRHVARSQKSKKRESCEGSKNRISSWRRARPSDAILD